MIGNSGVAKTRTVEDTLEDRGAIINGKATPWGFYQWAHDHIDQTLVLDDMAASFFRNEHSQAMLKQLLDTRRTKRLCWPTGATGDEKDYPKEFLTESRVIMLVNEWDSGGEHMAAIEGRVTSVLFDPSFAEVHAAVAEWFTDQEVFDYIYEHRRLCTKPNMRLYVKALEQKRAEKPWRKRTLEMMIGDERLQQMALILSDERYESNAQRQRAFTAAGYGSSSTFYLLLKEFRNLVPTADDKPIQLRNPQ